MQAQRISHISSGDSSAFSPCRGIFPGYCYIGKYMNHFPLYFLKGCSRYRHIFITRVSVVIMFSLCVVVCFFVSLSWCLSGRFNFVGLVPHKHYFAGTLLGMSSCASSVSHTHDVIDDVTRWQSRSNFEIDISSSIFELECRSKAQNIGYANGYRFGIFNFWYHFRLKSLSQAQNGGHFENFETLNTASIWPQDMKRSSQIMPYKVFFMMMTSPMTSQDGLKVDPLYSLINEITSFFMVTSKYIISKLPVRRYQEIMSTFI